MRIGFLACVTWCLVGCAGVPNQSQELIVAPTRVERFDPVGFCQAGREAVDLHRLDFRNERSLTVEDEHGARVVELAREAVRIEGADGETLLNDIGRLVELRPGQDVDIVLSFATVDGRTVVYWRETYQNRSYRQGLMRILRERVEPLCEGIGGIDRSH